MIRTKSLTIGLAAIAAVTAAMTAPAELGAATVVKRALVIGNAEYSKGALKNPLRDARAVGDALQSIGFKVTRQANLTTRRELRRAVNGFVDSIGPSDLALVFYAGHAVELKGKNYLLPVSFAASNEEDAVEDAYALDTLIGRLSKRRAGVNVVILDACRDDPFTRSWSRSVGSRGLREVEVSSGQSYLAFSTAPGSVASDGVGANSPFTAALVQEITQPGIDLDVMFRRVRARVRALTDNKQDPWSRNNLLGAVHLVPGAAPATAAVAPAVSTPVATPSPPSGAGRFGVEFVYSKPAGIELGRTEVTLAQYKACVAAGDCKKDSFRTRSDARYCNWGYDDRGEHPMNCVTWYGARDFCAAAGGRLPTEQEWEAEASDGGRRAYPWGSQAASCALAVMDDGRTTATAGAETDGCGHDSTAKVCSRSAGASVSKLCDMSGNVWEWTSTEEVGSRVLRGGSWLVDVLNYLRAAGRVRRVPSLWYYDVGFRCAR